jgi:hypothetical protein
MPAARGAPLSETHSISRRCGTAPPNFAHKPDKGTSWRWGEGVGERIRHGAFQAVLQARTVRDRFLIEAVVCGPLDRGCCVWTLMQARHTLPSLLARTHTRRHIRAHGSRWHSPTPSRLPSVADAKALDGFGALLGIAELEDLLRDVRVPSGIHRVGIYGMMASS